MKIHQKVILRPLHDTVKYPRFSQFPFLKFKVTHFRAILSKYRLFKPAFKGNQATFSPLPNFRRNSAVCSANPVESQHRV